MPSVDLIFLASLQEIKIVARMIMLLEISIIIEICEPSLIVKTLVEMWLLGPPRNTGLYEYYSEATRRMPPEKTFMSPFDSSVLPKPGIRGTRSFHSANSEVSQAVHSPAFNTYQGAQFGKLGAPSGAYQNRVGQHRTQVEPLRNSQQEASQSENQSGFSRVHQYYIPQNGYQVYDDEDDDQDLPELFDNDGASVEIKQEKHSFRIFESSDEEES